jgi:hypothetical protein
LTLIRKNVNFSTNIDVIFLKESKIMKNIHFYSIFLLAFILVHAGSVRAQTYERKIIEYVRMISKGQTEQVASKLPDLKKKIPRSAGLIYVEGLVASNGDEAIRCFSIIADSFPHSEWADDALARLFEYHQNSGSPNEAEGNFERLRTEYPASPYLSTNYLRDVRFANYHSQQVQGGDYAVQIGAFSIRENAEKLQQRFLAEGYNVDIYENLLDGKNLLYLVWIGSFNNENEAQRIQTEVKTKYNIDGLIRMRSAWKRW